MAFDATPSNHQHVPVAMEQFSDLGIDGKGMAYIVRPDSIKKIFNAEGVPFLTGFEKEWAGIQENDPRPRIAIPMSQLSDYHIEGKGEALVVRPHIAWSMFNAGAIPVFTGHDEEWTSVVKACDGLLLIGGDGGLPKSAFINNESFAWKYPNKRVCFESKVATEAVYDGKNIFGICQGFQIAATLFGCKMTSNIDAFNAKNNNSLIRHRASESEAFERHNVNVVPKTILDSILPNPGNNILKDVVSIHYGAIIETPKEDVIMYDPSGYAHKFRVVVNAIAPDGTIEGIEVVRVDGQAFSEQEIVGTQFHLEAEAGTEHPSMRMFNNFINRCAVQKLAFAAH